MRVWLLILAVVLVVLAYAHERCADSELRRVMRAVSGPIALRLYEVGSHGRLVPRGETSDRVPPAGDDEAADAVAVGGR